MELVQQLLRGERTQRAALIDSGKAEHAAALRAAVSSVAPDGVAAIVATHGHHDHVGGAEAFDGVPKYVHTADLELIAEGARAQWLTQLRDDGEVFGLRSVLLGQHASGSVALFHPSLARVVCGDHPCFFGATLGDEGLVGFGAARRERTIGNCTWRGEHWPPDADETERLRADLGQRAAQDQRRYDFPLLVDGLRRLCAMFEPEVLCTGHGPVLRGDIRAFLQKLVEVARV